MRMSALRIATTVAAALVIIAAASFWLGRSAAPQTSTPPAGKPAGLPSAPASPSAPSSNAAATGRAVSVGRQFVTAWLDRNPATRERALRTVCSENLAAELSLTDPAKIPDVLPVGGVIPVTADPYAARLAQGLSDSSLIYIELVSDPDRGWIVTNVKPG